MDTKLINNKQSKGIVATLVAILIIFIAAVVMVRSYSTINKVASGLKDNYLESSEFGRVIAKTNYALYYDDLIKNSSEKKDPKTELVVNNSINEETDYHPTRYFNDIFYTWQAYKNDENLKYYSYSAVNQSSDTNSKNDLTKIENGNSYFYATIKYDQNGNMTIENVIGADKDYLEMAITNGVYYVENEWECTFKPIENMTFIYEMPKEMIPVGHIYWNMTEYNNNTVGIVGAFAAGGVAIVIALIALFFPIKKAKNMAVFNGLSKIPFEVGILICIGDIFLIIISSLFMIPMSIDGYINTLIAELIKDFTISQPVIWILNVVYWFLIYFVVFFAVLVFKYIFNMGIGQYFKRRTIVGRVIMFFVRYIRNTVNLVTSVDLSDKNNKLIIKLVAINAAILLVISSIWLFGIPVVIIYSIVLFFVVRNYVDKIRYKYSKLREATSKIAEGNLDVNIEEDLGLFEPFKVDLEKIQGGFKKAVEEEVKSQRMKTDLISNVSHDLKTPLTAIITYTDLLKDENLPEDKRAQYVEILDKKAQRLQVLIEDLFEMSKATSGNITLNIESVDVVSLMKQTLLELEDKIQSSLLQVRENYPEEKIILQLDGARTFRVFENLVINMTKYAMPKTRAYIDIIDNDSNVEIIMKNMASEEITFDTETIAERFVRGDESRNTEGSGLGLAIAKSFVELQGGKFKIEVDGDLFKVIIRLNK